MSTSEYPIDPGMRGIFLNNISLCHHVEVEIKLHVSYVWTSWTQLKSDLKHEYSECSDSRGQVPHFK